MREILEWDGGRVVSKPQASIANELACLSESLAEGLAAVRDCDGLENLSPELVAAINRVERAHRMAPSLFLQHDLAPEQRAERLRGFGDLLFEMTLAEAEFVAALARARAAWFARFGRCEG